MADRSEAPSQPLTREQIEQLADCVRQFAIDTLTTNPSSYSVTTNTVDEPCEECPGWVVRRVVSVTMTMTRPMGGGSKL